MAGLPYMRFYPSDFVAGTTELTTEEVGAYILLLSKAWERGGELDDDPERLARIARVSPERWPAMWAAISQFWVASDDRAVDRAVHRRLTNRRLTIELKRAQAAYDQQREASAKGVKARLGRSEGPKRPDGQPSGSPDGQPDGAPIQEPRSRIQDPDQTESTASRSGGVVPSGAPPLSPASADPDRARDPSGTYYQPPTTGTVALAVAPATEQLQSNCRAIAHHDASTTRQQPVSKASCSMVGEAPATAQERATRPQSRTAARQQALTLAGDTAPASVPSDRSGQQHRAAVVAFCEGWKRKYGAPYGPAKSELANLKTLIASLPEADRDNVPLWIENYLADDSKFLVEEMRHSLSWFATDGRWNRFRVQAHVVKKSPLQVRREEYVDDMQQRLSELSANIDKIEQQRQERRRRP